MGVSFAVVLFLAATIGWILLAFVPGIREILRRSDTDALPVSRDSRVDIRHFARGFRDHLDRRYGELVAQCRAAGRPLVGERAETGAYLILPGGDAEPYLPEGESEFCERTVVSTGDLRLPDDFVHAAEVRAEGGVIGGERSVYRAVLADGAVRLAAGSASLRWLHAGTDLSADDGCLLHGRLSADRTLRLGYGCRFERLHAPRIDFGAERDAAAAPAAAPAADAGPQPLDADEIPHLKDTRGGRWFVERDFELASDQVLASDMVVCGDVILRQGARVRGSLKCRGEMILEPGVTVAGSLVCERDLTVGEDCRVDGPVICEKTLTLERDCRVGETDRPTTVSARRILVEPGARCHGTVWAHEQGDVLAPQGPAGDVAGRGGATS